MELVDTMIRRRIIIIFLQETKWVGESLEIENTGCRWFMRKERNEIENNS